MAMDEQKRIELAIRGDEQALAQILHDHYPFLLKYLMKVTVNKALAEDLAQETMLKCIEKIALYNGTSKFSSWLMTIATRLYIDQMRRKKIEHQWREQEQAMRQIRWQIQNRQEDWTDAMEALFRLGYEARVPILLKHYYGYAYEEIAEIMKVPIGTVKSRVFNGLQQLRKELVPHE